MRSLIYGEKIYSIGSQVMAISKIGEANVSGKFYFTRTWPLGHRYDKVKLQYHTVS